mgnify:CR=1 FL=1
MKHSTNHHDTLKLMISFFIVLVAFSIFFLLNSYSDVIYEGGNYNAFYILATLATVASGLLIGLLYIVNNSKNNSKSSIKSPKKHKKSRK